MKAPYGAFFLAHFWRFYFRISVKITPAAMMKKARTSQIDKGISMMVRALQ